MFTNARPAPSICGNWFSSPSRPDCGSKKPSSSWRHRVDAPVQVLRRQLDYRHGCHAGCRCDRGDVDRRHAHVLLDRVDATDVDEPVM